MQLLPISVGFVFCVVVHAQMFTDDLRGRVFDPDTISALRGMLSEHNRRIRQETAKTLSAAGNHGQFLLRPPFQAHTRIDDICRRVFDSGIISALCGRLSDLDVNVRIKAAKTFAVAANQG